MIKKLDLHSSFYGIKLYSSINIEINKNIIYFYSSETGYLTKYKPSNKKRYRWWETMVHIDEKFSAHMMEDFTPANKSELAYNLGYGRWLRRSSTISMGSFLNRHKHSDIIKVDYEYLQLLVTYE